MPRVQLYQGGQVNPQGTTDARVRPADFGPGIGGGVSDLGQGVGQFAAVQSRLNEIHDEAATKEATTAVNQFWAEQAYTAPGAYFTTAGKATLEAKPGLEKGLDDHIKEVRAGLKSPRQQQMFDEAVNPQRLSWGVDIAKHAEKETTTWAAGESAARATLSSEEAKRSYINDPAMGENYIATGLDEITARGHLEGWGDERILAERMSYESKTRRDIGEALAYAGPGGPELAQRFTELHADTMTADDRSHVQTSARVVTNQELAEQRRAEAEARRERREAASDAKDRANSVYRNIQDGVPVDAETLSGAIADARVADDPALAEGLRQGGLKNSLTLQYAGAAPVELQDRVNALSAEISQQGAKVKPDVVVERDHLQTLLGNANAAIASDPLSWGAAALKISPGTLDLNNTQSIAERSQFAMKVARRTGGQIRPMTNEEAATFAPIVAGGSVGQRTKLAVRLAKFGALADAAAKQVAPNNAGFQGLVGLAGLNNEAVAMSRVNQVVAGQEILKTNPKMIKGDDALRQFDGFVGNALQFLPSVRQGVLDNAQAILANDANEKGLHEWPEARPRWFAAVNSALGAYARDGKQYGGLAGFNGAATVLPEDMDLGEFETRISRATKADFFKAHNGEPVYSTGKSPTVADIKKMQWVPANNGVYRLSDGNGFLRTKDHRFYEIDVSKLGR